MDKYNYRYTLCYPPMNIIHLFGLVSAFVRVWEQSRNTEIMLSLSNSIARFVLVSAMCSSADDNSVNAAARQECQFGSSVRVAAR